MQTPFQYRLCVSTLLLLDQFSSPVAAAVDCRGGTSPFVITTQQDADSLLGCIDEKLSEERRLKIGYQGDVTVSPSATGVLNFTGYDYVNGSLLVENARGLDKLYLWPAKSPGHPSPFHGATLRNLRVLTTFGQFGQESTPHRTVLRDLPLLQNLTLDGPGFAQPVDLELADLPVLYSMQTMKSPIRPTGNLTIANTSLNTTDNFLPASSSGNTKNPTVGSLTVKNNIYLKSFPIAYDDLTNLTIESNPQLHSVLFNESAANYSWSNIRIAFNGGLRLKSALNKNLKPGQSPWNIFYWPTKNVSSMVFEGQFDDAFFQPFIDLGKDKSKRPLVLNNFEVYSGLDGTEFNCSKLNELRKAGILQGYYSCNYQTPRDESGSSLRARVSVEGVWGVVLGLVGVLVFHVV